MVSTPSNSAFCRFSHRSGHLSATVQFSTLPFLLSAHLLFILPLSFPAPLCIQHWFVHSFSSHPTLFTVWSLDSHSSFHIPRAPTRFHGTFLDTFASQDRHQLHSWTFLTHALLPPRSLRHASLLHLLPAPPLTRAPHVHCTHLCSTSLVPHTFTVYSFLFLRLLHQFLHAAPALHSPFRYTSAFISWLFAPLSCNSAFLFSVVLRLRCGFLRYASRCSDAHLLVSRHCTSRASVRLLPVHGWTFSFAHAALTSLLLLGLRLYLVRLGLRHLCTSFIIAVFLAPRSFRAHAIAPSLRFLFNSSS